MGFSLSFDSTTSSVPDISDLHPASFLVPKEALSVTYQLACQFNNGRLHLLNLPEKVRDII